MWGTPQRNALGHTWTCDPLVAGCKKSERGKKKHAARSYRWPRVALTIERHCTTRETIIVVYAKLRLQLEQSSLTRGTRMGCAGSFVCKKRGRQACCRHNCLDKMLLWIAQTVNDTHMNSHSLPADLTSIPMHLLEEIPHRAEVHKTLLRREKVTADRFNSDLLSSLR